MTESERRELLKALHGGPAKRTYRIKQRTLNRLIACYHGAKWHWTRANTKHWKTPPVPRKFLLEHALEAGREGHSWAPEELAWLNQLLAEEML